MRALSERGAVIGRSQSGGSTTGAPARLDPASAPSRDAPRAGAAEPRAAAEFAAAVAAAWAAGAAGWDRLAEAWGAPAAAMPLAAADAGCWWAGPPWYGKIDDDAFRAVVGAYVAHFGYYTPTLPLREPALLRQQQATASGGTVEASVPRARSARAPRRRKTRGADGPQAAA